MPDLTKQFKVVQVYTCDWQESISLPHDFFCFRSVVNTNAELATVPRPSVASLTQATPSRQLTTAASPSAWTTRRAVAPESLADIFTGRNISGPDCNSSSLRQRRPPAQVRRQPNPFVISTVSESLTVLSFYQKRCSFLELSLQHLALISGAVQSVVQQQQSHAMQQMGGGHQVSIFTPILLKKLDRFFQVVQQNCLAI